MILHAGADAAPERVSRRGVGAERAWLEGAEIRHARRGGILRREDVVVQPAFVEIHVGGRRIPGEHVTRELEHVVGIAGLGRLGPQMQGKVGHREKMFAVAVSAVGERARHGHSGPERGRDRAVPDVAGQLVFARGADHLGYLCIRVEPVEGISALSQRAEHGVMIEDLRQAQKVRRAGDGVEVREDLVHAAKLRFEECLLLLVCQPIHAELDPLRQADGDVERFAVAAQLIGVEQAGENLVQGVVGRPHCLPRLDAIEELLGERGQVPGVIAAPGQRRLDFPELGHQQVGPRLEPLVARARVHQRQRRQEMARAVSA